MTLSLDGRTCKPTDAWHNVEFRAFGARVSFLTSLPKRQAVIVLGTHRGGTSALAGALGLLGARLPARLMPAGPGNLKGHFEPRHIVAIHDRILAAAGTTWSGWEQVSVAWQRSEACQPFVEELAVAVLEDYGTTGVFVVKDPRMCRLVPLWLRVLERVGAQASFAIPFRDPVEVARSLAVRNDLTLPHGCLTWLRGVLDAERQSRGHPRAFLRYRELVDDPRAALERLVAALPVAWPRTPGEAGRELQEFIDPALRVQIADARAVDGMGDYSPWLRQAMHCYELLASGADEAAARHGLDELTAVFDTADAAFTPAIEHEIKTNRAEVARLQSLTRQQQDAIDRILHLRNAEMAASRVRIGELETRGAAVDELTALRSRTAAMVDELTALRSRTAAMVDELTALRSRTAAMAGEIAGLRSATSWRVTSPLRSCKRLFVRIARNGPFGVLPVVGWRVLRTGSLRPLRDLRAVRTIARSGLFDRAWYLARHPEVAAAGIDPIRHYVMFGVHEGREPPPSFNPRDYLAHAFDDAAAGADPCVHVVPHEACAIAGTDLRPQDIQFVTASGMMAHLMAPTEAPFNDDGYFITRFMHYIWRLRPDVNSTFDLADKRSRLEFCEWFLLWASREYDLPAEAYPDRVLARLIGCGGAVGEKAGSVLAEKRRLAATARGADARAKSGSAAEPEADGANIIGYYRGEFGMGEFSRTIVRSFAAVGLPFSAIDHPEAGIHGKDDTSVEHFIGTAQRSKVNIFNINPDVLPSLYFKFGQSFFTDRFNIGYWAWELPQCPPEFDIALAMVDEVWALSDFTADSFRTRSPVPVFSMPLAVSVPTLRRPYTKRDFGVPEDSFTFLFSFDAASYLARKNPIAAVRAFKQAFRRGTEKVRLVLKTMNVPAVEPLWDALVAEAQSDTRIEIINRRLSRDEVVGLTSVCDAIVSLHRSEGFGLTVAEAMLLGKPAVVTNYSGTRDFAREDTACVVDFELVHVPPGQYPFWSDQVWADPDVGHAASLMRRLVDDEPYRRDIARAGQSFVAENLNEKVVGARYAKRLDQLRTAGFRSARADQGHERRSAEAANDAIAGSIDLPALGTVIPRATAVEVSGWFASRAGIESLEVFCDAKLVGQAHRGDLRTDVGRAYPELKDAAHAGFVCIVDSERLAVGLHQLRVVARSRSGRERELTRRFSLDGVTAYERWLKSHAIAPADEGALAARAAHAAASPLITLLLALEQPPDQAGIAATLRSISDQAYRNFEVLVVVPSGASGNMDAGEASGIADRIRVVPTRDGGLWKEALAQASGDFIAVVEAGDVLDPRALLAVAENLAEDPTIDFLYADEDRIVGDGRGAPSFKPSYSPIFLESHDYVGRPWFARRTLLSSAVEAGAANDPACEHVLVRHVGRTARAVGHIPMVLLSRPDHRPAVVDRAEAPLSPDIAGDERWPRVSIVIPTCLNAPHILAKCLSGLAELTDYPDVETVIVVNNVADAQAAKEFLGRWPVKVLTWDRPYGWSGINNFAARHAGGDHLLFLNDDVEPLAPDWLKQMVRLGRRSAVGAVGATLRYPDGTIQHGGISISNRAASGRHLFRHRTGREPAVAGIAGYARECRAVTGACLLTRRDCFEAVGGFDEDMQLVANDVDYCLRLDERGYSTVMAAQAVLTHYEGLSRGASPERGDIERFWKRWRARLSTDDPFTNPNLDVERDDWSVDPEARATLTARVWRSRECRSAGAARPEEREQSMPSDMPSFALADWPIAPPFNFNAPTVSQFSPEVTGRVLLSDMCARLGWSSLAGKRLLDFGCGVRFVRTIVNLEMEIGQYAGVDLDGGAIGWLKANVRDPRFRFERLDMGNPMYNPSGPPVVRTALAELGLSGYDAACMFSVITHQEPADAATIFAMLRLCAPRLYFTAFIDDAIDGHEDRDPATRCHHSFYSSAFLTRLLTQNGWRVEAIFPPGRFQQTAFVCA